MKMGKGNVQARLHLLGAALLIAAFLMAFIDTADGAVAAPLISVEKQDLIDRGLDKFYGIIGRTKGVSLEVADGYGVRLGEKYTDKERILFVAGVLLLGVIVLSLVACCCRCLQGRRRRQPVAPAYIVPPNPAKH